MGGTATRFAPYGRGESIVRQGEPDAGLYIIHEGRVDLAVADTGDDAHLIDQLIAGEVFGEMVSLLGESSPVTATAAADAAILIIDHGAFRQLLQRHHPFALQINALIERRRTAIDAALHGDKRVTGAMGLCAPSTDEGESYAG